ncbi:MAG: 6-bladed beta-propeller [Gemmatimonadales bacterium]
MKNLRNLDLLFLVLVTACSASDATVERTWRGTIDTLPSGQVVTANTADPLWSDADAWRVTEDLRIGSVDAEGPELFGRIVDLEVDPAGRIYVLESQAKELRVFNADGSHLRTVGREGGGPGEFNSPVMLQLGPDGNLWVADPQNNRVSVFDTAGTFLTSKPAPGGFVIIPWPGGFDAAGHYYGPVPRPAENEFRMALVRYDTSFATLDTLTVPRYTGKSERFEMHSDGGTMWAGVPYSPGLLWHLSRGGTIWGMLTGEYKLFELSPEGDTLRSVTREFDPLPVTDADIEQAKVNLDWFTRQGGKIDLSKIPSYKPATRDFFFDDASNIWVVPVTSDESEHDRFDIFDPDGRYLGRLNMPFDWSGSPYPIFQGSTMYAVTTDDLGVPFVVRARIEKPGA